MEYHNLLRRQIKKYVSDSDLLDHPDLLKLLAAVNESYRNYDQDKALSQRAFDLADQEYFAITNKLLEEKKLREQSIEMMLNSILTLEDDPNTAWKYGKDDLLMVANYLSYQVTKRKEIEEELKKAIIRAEKASKAKSEFLSTMSHEIRSPLNVIIGMVHILRKEEHLLNQVENLEVLDITSRNLLLLINDILDYSKIESGKLELDNTDFNLVKLASNIHYANINPAKERGNKLLLSIDDNFPQCVVGDSVRIGQIITNLLSNAIKFTKDGSIKLGLALLNKENGKSNIRISVQDTGIGISKESQKKIFEHFTQAKSDTTREYGGTGLGLAITKQLLRLMGSEIHLESESGYGSTFSFVLSLPEGHCLEKKVYDTGRKKDLSGAKILVVDDLEFNLIVVKKITSDWNVNLDYARNGLEALQCIQNNNYDLVLMDLQMPVMDGQSATVEVRKFNTHVPIIALTASSNETTKQALLEAGMNDYLTKPFNPEVLYQKLRDSLSISRTA